MIALAAATLLHIMKLLIAHKKDAVISNQNNTGICFCGDDRIMHLIFIISKIEQYESLLKKIAVNCIMIIEILEQLMMNKFSIIRMFEINFYFAAHSWLIAIHMGLNSFENRHKFYSSFCLLIPEYVSDFEKNPEHEPPLTQSLIRCHDPYEVRSCDSRKSRQSIRESHQSPCVIGTEIQGIHHDTGIRSAHHRHRHGEHTDNEHTVATGIRGCDNEGGRDGKSHDGAVLAHFSGGNVLLGDKVIREPGTGVAADPHAQVDQGREVAVVRHGELEHAAEVLGQVSDYAEDGPVEADQRDYHCP
ncbi:hypothetical protein TSAR_005021 [Trichomalopsis sarcophagae]|uniref:Uncharacterized protein n=1 Tax=Trichomalopsis sarcophagae TaxID=543379 RepID=A0A232FBK7_9HYME|nr:hypothetical protein TSAR_005021 [Trichomalopsis sarcophagae]